MEKWLAYLLPFRHYRKCFWNRLVLGAAGQTAHIRPLCLRKLKRVHLRVMLETFTLMMQKSI